jgi:hypothetical protein
MTNPEFTEPRKAAYRDVTAFMNTKLSPERADEYVEALGEYLTQVLEEIRQKCAERGRRRRGAELAE